MSNDLSLCINGHTDKNDERSAAQSLQSDYAGGMLNMNRHDSNYGNSRGADKDKLAQSRFQKLGSGASRFYALNSSPAASQIFSHIFGRQNYGGIEKCEEYDEQEINE